MRAETKLSGFARYAWFVLGYNVLVIVWGVFLRASKSGDGCGQHWLTCHGELIPSAPEFKTVIEFSHRIMSALDGLIMLVLVIWAFQIWYRSREHQSRLILRTSIGSLVFVITEALVGAGLVLTGNTAEAVTAVRPFWAIGHLINTFILLTFLTLTAWLASGSGRNNFRVNFKTTVLIGVAVLALLFVGMSGSIAALSNMLFPSETLSEGIVKDFSDSSNILLRLRLSHPLLSILAVVYVFFLAGWLRKQASESRSVAKWSNILSILLIVQLAFGAATLLTLGPIVMQLGHLLLADAIWIVFVLLVASYLSNERTAVDQRISLD
ncbi:MAG: COX15/CtaA family protein [Blastocatellia bacterium]